MDNTSSRRILNKIVAKLSKNHIVKGRLLADILMGERKSVRWDPDGNITHPVLRNIGAFDLGTLVRTILYKKKSREKDSLIAARNIKTFFDKLLKKSVIGNDLLDRSFVKAKPEAMAKYVAW